MSSRNTDLIRKWLDEELKETVFRSTDKIHMYISRNYARVDIWESNRTGTYRILLRVSLADGLWAVKKELETRCSTNTTSKKELRRVKDMAMSAILELTE